LGTTAILPFLKGYQQLYQAPEYEEENMDSPTCLPVELLREITSRLSNLGALE